MKLPLFILVILAYLTGSLSLAQTPVDRAQVMTIGGIKQYTTIKGKDSTLPLLLFLHGGPGGSVMGYSDRFTQKLQEHFVVVQWDQRETGKTREMNASPVPLSLEIFQSDTYEMITSLLAQFNRRKLYVAGHSWGTVLAFDIARKYPDLLYACMAIGPMINQLESERIALDVLKGRALKSEDKEQIEELSKVRIPFETGEQLFFHRKWLLRFAGSSREFSKTYVETWSTTWLKLFNEASRENLFESLPAVDCPVYFFAGRHDFQTNSSITEKYYLSLRAPKKALFWFERSAHSIPSSEPARLQQLIIEKVLPETFTLQKAAERLVGEH